MIDITTPKVDLGSTFVWQQPRAAISVELKVLRTIPGIPTYATRGAAAVDLIAAINEPIFLMRGGKSVLIPTGISIHIKNPNFCAVILPRSGLGHKNGLVLGNGVGLIDSDYQGEIMVSAHARLNGDMAGVEINPGDRIAQLMLLPVIHASFVPVSEFTDESQRGEGGFGSTGVQ
jgi:dUTP pyrophosphatase